MKREIEEMANVIAGKAEYITDILAAMRHRQELDKWGLTDKQIADLYTCLSDTKDEFVAVCEQIEEVVNPILFPED